MSAFFTCPSRTSNLSVLVVPCIPRHLLDSVVQWGHCFIKPKSCHLYLRLPYEKWERLDIWEFPVGITKGYILGDTSPSPPKLARISSGCVVLQYIKSRYVWNFVILSSNQPSTDMYIGCRWCTLGADTCQRRRDVSDNDVHDDGMRCTHHRRQTCRRLPRYCARSAREPVVNVEPLSAGWQVLWHAETVCQVTAVIWPTCW